MDRAPGLRGVRDARVTGPCQRGRNNWNTRAVPLRADAANTESAGGFLRWPNEIPTKRLFEAVVLEALGLSLTV